jgi:hypothetical protein
MDLLVTVHAETDALGDLCNQLFGGHRHPALPDREELVLFHEVMCGEDARGSLWTKAASPALELLNHCPVAFLPTIPVELGHARDPTGSWAKKRSQSKLAPLPMLSRGYEARTS